MKIYSWNIWFRNKNFDRAFEYIKTLDFDVLCLQEVPKDFLERLQTLQYSICFAPEVDRLLRGTRTTHYGVIVSKHLIQKFESIPLPYWESQITLRTRIFVSSMVALGLWSWGLGNRHAIYADIKTEKGIVRVFNLHLVLKSPQERLQEFEMCMKHLDPSLPTVVAGDFNIIESPRVSILNWILGGSLSDSLFWNRERTQFEKHFGAHGFKNPLGGAHTHAISASQLDHILVPASASVLDTRVEKGTYGSDHRMVFVEYKEK